MRRLVTVASMFALGLSLGLCLRVGSPTALAGVEKCAAKNGDVNADGAVDLSDAVTILGNLFLGSPPELVPLCTTPAASGLPDTGQKVCYIFLENQGWVEVPCGEAACVGQDGFYQTGCSSEGRFVDNGDGTVTDHCTGLMWQKNTADVNGDGRVPEDFSDGATWCNALAYCDNLNLAGYKDWRLPNIRELQSLVDYARSSPAMDPVFGALPSMYWSSTSNVGNPGSVWYVAFNGGFVLNVGDKGIDRFYIRAVRRGT